MRAGADRRGHRLVADDVVDVRRRAESFVDGPAPETRALLHGGARRRPDRHAGAVRRVGDLHGQADRPGRAARALGRTREYERLGLDDQWHELLGVRVPLVRMPVAPGRSIATLVEVAARNELLKARGYNAARELTSRLAERRTRGRRAASAETRG